MTDYLFTLRFNSLRNLPVLCGSKVMLVEATAETLRTRKLRRELKMSQHPKKLLLYGFS